MNNTLPIVTVTLNPALDRTLHLPSFTLGKVNRVDTERTDPGGKGINVAKVITALGHPVVVTGFLGKKNAYTFQDYFKQKGLRFDAVYDEGGIIASPGSAMEMIQKPMALVGIGEKGFLLIPSAMGYGARGAGGSIPPNSPLVFEVELLGVK